jgi:DNA-binding HxlR family transcriptional regulator
MEGPLVKRRTYGHSPAGCPTEATLDAIGGKYKGMLLYHLLDGTKRFGELRKLMPNVTQRTMTLQLRELETVGIVSRKVYPIVPPKVEYSLTELGRSLEPILRLMQAWGVEHMDEVERAVKAASSEEQV